MRLIGDARRRKELEAADARWQEYCLRRELEGLQRHHHHLRYLKDRHERETRLPWVQKRIPAVAQELSMARARAARLRDELEAGRA